MKLCVMFYCFLFHKEHPYAVGGRCRGSNTITDVNETLHRGQENIFISLK
jgi:hypothetical protein